MTQPALALEYQGLLGDNLDREFSSDSLGELGDGAAKDVPWRLWRKALYAPLHDFLHRPGKEFRAELVEVCWRLGGRKDSPPLELLLVVEALHAGSLIVDDIEDASTERRGRPALHHIYGMPTALNAGNWLYFWPFRLLDRLDVSSELKAAAHRMTTRVLLECHYGQALDLSVDLSALDPNEVPGVVRAISELKTGSLVGLAAGLGALMSGADENIVRAAVRFGRDLGVGLQMLDDLSGLVNEKRRHKGAEDLENDKPTWPWAWLATSLDAKTFSALQTMARDVINDSPWEPLAERLGALVTPFGKTRVHAFLQHAKARLADAVPDAPVLAALELEIDRLERSYV